jgi:5-methyltetrahydrofolate--homocysteine methyltransferase
LPKKECTSAEREQSYKQLAPFFILMEKSIRGENMVDNLTTILSSATQTVEISRDRPTVIIGERINPTGRKMVLAALQEGNFDIVRQDALDQVAAGAAVLDVNAGVPGADEPALLQQVMRTVMEVTGVPLCIDTADPVALEAALK